MQVTLTVHGEERDGEQFVFGKPGSLVFGRSSEAQCQIAHDPYVSRNHFLLLINPPDVRLRNLSRTNGTVVDGVLYTQGHATPTSSGDETLVKGVSTRDAEAVLSDGSQIEAGYTRITVAVQARPYCVECGREFAAESTVSADEMPLCPACRPKQPGQSMRGRSRPRRDLPDAASRPRGQHAEGGDGTVRRMIQGILSERRPAARGVPDISGYRIGRKLAEGGMGMVLEATRLEDGRKVAIKIVRPDRAGNSEISRRFRREIRIINKLDHPNIVPLLDFGESRGVLWFAMEFVEGGHDVEKHLKAAGGRLPWKECMKLMLPALDGLAQAHRHDVIHRDIKPSNILLAGKPGRLISQITDFGIAKSLEDVGLNGSILTKPALAMGTLPYMAPEQARDVRTSKKTADVFSMGATLYQMLSGRLIRDPSPNVNDGILRVISEPPTPLASRGVRLSGSLVAVVGRALSMEPGERFADAEKFHDALGKAT